MRHWIKKHKVPLLLLFILVIITYGNALNNDFLSDDIAEITQNSNIGNFSAIFNHTFGYIRPFLYWLIYSITGFNQIIFRLLNFFFHTGSVFVLYAILSFIYSKNNIAFIAAAIFAVHPAISEAVVWISGGMYPQYAFFFLLSFLLYLISKTNKKYYILSIIFFLFSFMSHPQMPLALFLAFPLYEISFGNLNKNWKRSIPYFIVTLVFVLITLGALPERTNTLQSVNYQEQGTDNLFVLIPIAISSYIELILWPQGLTLYHSELSFGSINFAIRAIFTLIFLGGILISLRKNKNIFFWGSLFLLSLAPTLTPFRLNWIVAERYLYLASIGIFVITALGISKLTSIPKLKPFIYAILILILSILSIRTILRNIDWKNQDNLWVAAGKTSPSSPNNHNNLGDMFGRHGDKQAALKEFQTAISLKPNYGDAYHNLANTYRELGDSGKAIENYQNALKYNPNLWQSYQNIAAIHFEKAKLASNSAKIAEAEYSITLENIQKAIQINPTNINLVNNLGIVYLASGNKPKAKEIFNLVLSADPQNQFALAGLAQASK